MKLVLGLFSLLALSSCATYQNKVADARAELTRGNCDAALKAFEALSSKADGDQLLYLMEQGSALQICGDFGSSNGVFLRADQLSEQVDYHSASRIVGATLLNEEMIQYKGDVFEKLFINASAALNYAELGQAEDAMVEVRRIDEKYAKFSAEEKNSYELNSFAQYLSGLLWEAGKNYDDACISYQASYKVDSSYRNVGLDMLSACWRAKRYQEFETLAKSFNPSADEMKFIKRKNKNEVILVYLQGLGPRKFARPDNHLYPYLVPSSSLIKKIIVNYEGEKGEALAETSQPVFSVEKAAIATLEADVGALTARRVGARVAKEVVADQIRQKDKALGNIAWLVMVASERADLRNWTLLPESIQVVRVNARPNSKLKVSGLNAFQGEVQSLKDVDLAEKPNKKIYLLRTIK